MAKGHIVYSPSDEFLFDRKNWHKSENNRYSASRSHILIVHRVEDSKIYREPPYLTVNVAAGSRIDYSRKRVKVVRRTEEIANTISETLSDSISQQIASDVTAKLSAGITNIKGEIGSSLAATLNTGLVNTLNSSLSQISTFEAEQHDEEYFGVKEVQSTASRYHTERTAYFFLGLQKHFWDVYLYKQEFLSLLYRPGAFRKKKRREITTDEITSVGKPLFRLSFFQPQSNSFPSLTEKAYTPDVSSDDMDEITALSLTSPCPRTRSDPPFSMEKLAKIAFPITDAEKGDAKDARAGPTLAGAPAGKPAAKSMEKAKAPAKKKAARKTTAKKSPAKRTTTKKKVTAKKAVKRKAPAKKTARKKTARRAKMKR